MKKGGHQFQAEWGGIYGRRKRENDEIVVSKKETDYLLLNLNSVLST